MALSGPIEPLVVTNMASSYIIVVEGMGKVNALENDI